MINRTLKALLFFPLLGLIGLTTLLFPLCYIISGDGFSWSEVISNYFMDKYNF